MRRPDVLVMRCPPLVAKCALHVADARALACPHVGRVRGLVGASTACILGYGAPVVELSTPCESRQRQKRSGAWRKLPSQNLARRKMLSSTFRNCLSPRQVRCFLAHSTSP